MDDDDKPSVLKRILRVLATGFAGLGLFLVIAAELVAFGVFPLRSPFVSLIVGGGLVLGLVLGLLTVLKMARPKPEPVQPGPPMELPAILVPPVIDDAEVRVTVVGTPRQRPAAVASSGSPAATTWEPPAPPAG